MDKAERVKRDGEIVGHYKSGKTTKEIGSMYGITSQAISLILKKYGANKSFEKICILEDCLKETVAKGYCRKHYRNFKLWGDPTKMLYGVPRYCKIVGCNKTHKALGLCNNHYCSYLGFVRRGRELKVKEFIEKEGKIKSKVVI